MHRHMIERLEPTKTHVGDNGPVDRLAAPATESDNASLITTNPLTQSSLSQTASPPVSLLTLMADRNIQICFMVALSTNVVFTGLEPIWSLHLKDAFMSSPSETGYLFIVIVIPAAISAVGMYNLDIGPFPQIYFPVLFHVFYYMFFGCFV